MVKFIIRDAHGQERQSRTCLAEVSRLLRQMRFEANRGASAEGQHVSVLIDPQWNDDQATLSVYVLCHAFGHMQVDWSQLAIGVRPENAQLPVRRVAYLDERGSAVFTDVQPGTYAVRAYERSRTKVVADLGPIRNAGQWAAAAARVIVPQDILVLRQPWTYTSANGRLVAILLPETDGIKVAFETEKPELADKTVTFALLTDDGAIVAQGDVRLQRHASATDLWTGDWPDAVDLGGQPCELVFQVLDDES